MLRNITVGIDIGTYQVKVVVAELVKNQGDGNAKFSTRIIGTGLGESKGMRHGYIINGAKVTQSIKTAVALAEKTSGVKIHKAFVAIGGIGLQGVTSTATTVISRADLEITELDIENIDEECEEGIPPALIQNRRILHSIPLSYKIDGKPVLAKTPLGMKGSKLEVKMLFVTCLDPHLNDLLQAVDESGIEVIDVMASPIAASFVTLSKQQKMAGAVLANIGAETISIVVFENNRPERTSACRHIYHRRRKWHRHNRRFCQSYPEIAVAGCGIKHRRRKKPHQRLHMGSGIRIVHARIFQRRESKLGTAQHHEQIGDKNLKLD